MHNKGLTDAVDLAIFLLERAGWTQRVMHIARARATPPARAGAGNRPLSNAFFPINQRLHDGAPGGPGLGAANANEGDVLYDTWRDLVERAQAGVMVILDDTSVARWRSLYANSQEKLDELDAGMPRALARRLLLRAPVATSNLHRAHDTGVIGVIWARVLLLSFRPAGHHTWVLHAPGVRQLLDGLRIVNGVGAVLRPNVCTGDAGAPLPCQVAVLAELQETDSNHDCVSTFLHNDADTINSITGVPANHFWLAVNNNYKVGNVRQTRRDGYAQFRRKKETGFDLRPHDAADLTPLCDFVERVTVNSQLPGPDVNILAADKHIGRPGGNAYISSSSTGHYKLVNFAAHVTDTGVAPAQNFATTDLGLDASPMIMLKESRYTRVANSNRRYTNLKGAMAKLYVPTRATRARAHTHSLSACHALRAPLAGTIWQKARRCPTALPTTTSSSSVPTRGSSATSPPPSALPGNSRDRTGAMRSALSPRSPLSSRPPRDRTQSPHLFHPPLLHHLPPSPSHPPTPSHPLHPTPPPPTHTPSPLLLQTPAGGSLGLLVADQQAADWVGSQGDNYRMLAQLRDKKMHNGGVVRFKLVKATLTASAPGPGAVLDAVDEYFLLGHEELVAFKGFK